VYLLTQQLPVATDAVDKAGRTCLHWACYQGDAISVELLLRFGYNPNKQDPGGLSALHWAVVKGNVGCISKVAEAGGDVEIKTNEGQTPFELSKQLSSIAAWNRAMASISRSPDGRPKKTPLSPRNTQLAVAILPCMVLYLVFKTFDILPWYTALPLAAAEFFGANHVITRVLLDAGGRHAAGMDDKVIKSPYLSGLLGGSVLWVGFAWVTKLTSGASRRCTQCLLTELQFRAMPSPTCSSPSLS
jgi:hypothetical protein